MTPEKKKVINGRTVEQYYWAGEWVTYVDGHLVPETFDEAVDKIAKGIDFPLEQQLEAMVSAMYGSSSTDIRLARKSLTEAAQALRERDKEIARLHKLFVDESSAHDATMEAKHELLEDNTQLRAFKAAVICWRQYDWHEGFSHVTADAIAENAKRVEQALKGQKDTIMPKAFHCTLSQVVTDQPRIQKMDKWIEIEDTYLTNQPLIRRGRKNEPDPDVEPTEAWMFGYRCSRTPKRRRVRRKRYMQTLIGDDRKDLERQIDELISREDVILVADHNRPGEYIQSGGEPVPVDGRESS